MSSNKESNMEQAKVTDAAKGDDKNLQPDSTTHDGKDENNSNDIDPIMKFSNTMNTIMNDVTSMKQLISSQDKKNTMMYRALQLSFEETKKQVFKCTDQYTNLHSEYSKQVIKLEDNLKRRMDDLEIKFKKLADDNKSSFSAIYQIMEENKKNINEKILEFKKDSSSNEKVNDLTEEVQKLKSFNEPVKKILYGVKDLLVNNLPTDDN